MSLVPALDNVLYQPLNGRLQEIRIIRLKPSKVTSEPLHCHLEVVSLLSAPGYESLSYAWGEGRPTEPLRIGAHEIKITQTLSDALRALRSLEDRRSLWVDAVCINQDDASEKNAQVSMMHLVYSRAHTVNIWLGGEFLGLDEAFTSLALLSEGMPFGTILRSHDPNNVVVESLISLFELPWWQRLWVVQEVLLANTAVVRCGSKSIGFDEIIQAFEFLWNEYVTMGQRLRSLRKENRVESLIKLLEATVRRLHITRNLVFTEPHHGFRRLRDNPKTWVSLLHICAWAEATDPRDRIYGTLGLLSSSEIVPDYSLTVEETYIRTTFYLIRKMGNLALLCQARPALNAANGLPTWVSDWREPATYTAPYAVFHELYHAGTHMKTDVQLSDVDNGLQTTASIIDVVKEIAVTFDDQGCMNMLGLLNILKPVLGTWMRFARLPGAGDSLSYVNQFTQIDTGQSQITTWPNGPVLINPPPYVVQSLRAPFYRDMDYRMDPNESKTFMIKPHKQLSSAMNPQSFVSNPNSAQIKTGTSTLPPKRKSSETFATITSGDDEESKRTNDAAASVNHARPRTYDSFSHLYVESIPPVTSHASPPSRTFTSKDSGPKYVTGAASSDVFWRTLCMDVMESPQTRGYRRCRRSDSHSFWSWLDWIYGVGPVKQIPSLHWRLRTQLQGKKMFRTVNGYIGLAHGDVTLGDKIAILAGEAYPYILRDVGDPSKKTFRLVSPSYLHGVMDGVVPHTSQSRQVVSTLISIV